VFIVRVTLFEPESGEWIQNHEQMHPSSGHAGMAAGTSKSVYRFHTQVGFVLKTAKSSGCTSYWFDLYVMASAHPATSLIELVWNWVLGCPGHGQSP
jgi:hypothetical protein